MTETSETSLVAQLTEMKAALERQLDSVAGAAGHQRSERAVPGARHRSARVDGEGRKLARRRCAQSSTSRPSASTTRRPTTSSRAGAQSTRTSSSPAEGAHPRSREPAGHAPGGAAVTLLEDLVALQEQYKQGLLPGVGRR